MFFDLALSKMEKKIMKTLSSVSNVITIMIAL